MQKEDTIQAVLIADAYERTLQPFVNEGSIVSLFIGFVTFFFCSGLNTTHDANVDRYNVISYFLFTKGMLPLVNTPLIDYALEALNRSKVEEVFLFATNFLDEIKAHVK